MPCANGDSYSFLVTSEWFEQKETYSVGDTIFLFSQFPKILTDQVNTNLSINYANSTGIAGNIGITRLDSINRQFIPAKDSFNFVNISGSFSEAALNTSIVKQINIFEKADKYEFLGGLICLKKGVYEIDVDDLNSSGIIGKNCTNAKFTMKVTNSIKNTHLYTQAIGSPPSVLRQEKMYVFRIR